MNTTPERTPQFPARRSRISECSRHDALGQSETPNHVRRDGSFPRKRLSGAGDGCAADHCQPSLLVVAELAPIADAGAGDRGICNGPKPVASRCIKFLGVEATNNESERALRTSVIFRRVTSGFRSEWSAKVYADLCSIVATGRLAARTALAAIRNALAVPLLSPNRSLISLINTVRAKLKAVLPLAYRA